MRLINECIIVVMIILVWTSVFEKKISMDIEEYKRITLYIACASDGLYYTDCMQTEHRDACRTKVHTNIDRSLYCFEYNDVNNCTRQLHEDADDVLDCVDHYNSEYECREEFEIFAKKFDSCEN